MLTNIEINKKIFNFLLPLIEEAHQNKNLKNTLHLIQILAQYSIHRYTTYLKSDIIENILNDISKTITKEDIQLKRDIKKKNILHVFTLTSPVGGHTRLAVNWIRNTFQDEEHSLLLTGQNEDEIPIWFKDEITKKQGEIYSLIHLKNDISKAQYLKSIEQNFDYIIFHLHMHDPIINLAFGDNTNSAKLLYVNHAEHLFWLGNKPLDVIVEYKTSSQSISRIKRDSKKSFVLDIPLEDVSKPKYTKEEARILLGIKKDAILFVSIASAYKFRPNTKVNFLESAKKIVNAVENSYMVIIGPSKDTESNWMTLYNETNGKINAIGYVSNPDELKKYHIALDTYLDSFPYISPTSFLEPALYNKAIISLSSCASVDSLDCISKSPGYVPTQDLYIEAAIDSAKNSDKYTIKNNIINAHLGENWRNRLQTLYNYLEEKKPFEVDYNEINEYAIQKRFDDFFINETNNSKHKNPFNSISSSFKKLDMKYKIPIMLEIFKYSNLNIKFKYFRYLFKRN